MLRKFRSERVAKRHKRIFWTKFVLFWIFLIILVLFLSYVSKQEKLNISNINITGNKIVKSEYILEIINKNIDGNYFWLFSKSNILIYPKSKIKEELMNNFLRIEDLIISFKNLQSIEINIKERKPFALYCENIVVGLLQNDGNNSQLATSTDLEMISSDEVKNLTHGELNDEICYFMDNEGYIYAEAMSFSKDVYFKYQQEITKENHLGVAPPSLGRVYLFEAGENQFEKVNLFIRFLKDINIDVYKLVVKENGDYELIFANDSLLIFDQKQDFEVLLENLQAVLIDLGDLEGKEFEYIDLRFDNKVLYKFKEKEP